MVGDILMLAVGGALLYAGAEQLVKGSAGIARAFGVAPIVVGLTVVAYGTSAPELVVTLIAAVEGQSAIALGNVVGSNIANLGLILGLTALIRPPRVDGGLVRRELPVLAGTTLLVPVLLWDGVLGRLEGALLVAGAIAFTVLTVRLARRADPELVAEARDEAQHRSGRGSRKKLVALAAVGLACLLAGGKLFVDGASGLALELGMSERLVGLTIVAVGTSLPELAASLVAAVRGHSDLAVGNIVGSNIFNVLMVLGGASLASPIVASLGESTVDLTALLVVTAVGIVSMRAWRAITRAEGAALLVLYGGFLVLVALL